MKIVFFLILTILSNTFLFSQFSFPGTGSEEDPYQVWTSGHFVELSDSLNIDRYMPARDCWHFGKYFRLMQDINVSISDQSLWSFFAFFSGNGKKITLTGSSSLLFSSITMRVDSLTVEVLGSDNVYPGIVGNISFLWNKYGMGIASFGTLSYCINNVSVVDFGTMGAYEYMYMAGGITYDNSGTISHCINNGSVSGVDFVAGIAPDSFHGKIFNCINTGKITATSTEIKEYYDYTGVAGITIEAPKTDFSNCINLGDIEGHYYVGGIASKSFTALFSSWTIVKNCINAGHIKGKKYVGGIIGFDFDLQPADIYNCINTGIVEGEEDVGNIVGKK